MCDVQTLIHPNNNNLSLGCRKLYAEDLSCNNLDVTTINGDPYPPAPGPVNSLVTSDLVDVPVLGALPVFSGLTPFETTPSNTLNIDGNLVSLNDGSLVFFNTAGVSGNTSTLQQEPTGQFSLNNNCLDGALSFGCGGDMAFNTPNRVFLTADGGTVVKSSLVVSDLPVASTSFNQLGTSFNLINNAVAGTVNLLSDGQVRLSSSTADILLQSSTGTSIENSLTLVGAVSSALLNISPTEDLNISNQSVSGGMNLLTTGDFGINSASGLVNITSTGDMNLNCIGLGNTLSVSSSGNLNLTSSAGSVSVSCPQDINMTSSAGSFFVNSASQFNGQMTTQDVQINGGYSLLLHDSTTGENGILAEDTNGFLNISNDNRITISTLVTGEGINLSTGESGYVEIRNTFAGNSGYLGLDNVSANFQVYSNASLDLTVDDPASFVVTTNNNGVVNKVQNCQAGAGAPSRPASPVAGEMFFDTSLGYPIWYSGVVWVNSTGGPV